MSASTPAFLVKGLCKLESIYIVSVTGPLQRHLCLLGLRKCISLQLKTVV